MRPLIFLFSALLIGCGHLAKDGTTTSDAVNCTNSHRDTVWEYPEKYGNFLKALDVAANANGLSDFYKRYIGIAESIQDGGEGKLIFARSREAVTENCKADEIHEYTTEYYMIRFSENGRGSTSCQVERRSFVAPFPYPDPGSREYRVPLPSEMGRCDAFLMAIRSNE